MKQTDSKAGYLQRFQTFAINRMVSPSAEEKDSLLYWRARILFAILFVGALLALLVFIPATAFMIKEGLWGLAIMDSGAWLTGVGLLFSRRLRYETRAALTLLILYSIGLAIIISAGPLSGGPAWLFAFAVLTGVLLGLKRAILALAINAITLTIIGWLITTGRFGQTFPFFNTSELMIVAGANFIFLNAVAAISVTVLVKGLVSIHQRERVLSSTLQIERSDLMEAKERLELEVRERKQAEETLRESEEKYRSLFEESRDAIVLTTQQGEVIGANRAALELFGYTKEEILKINFQKLYVDPNGGYKFQKEMKEKGSVQDFETKLRGKGDVEMDCILDCVCRRGDDGSILEYQGIIRDISEAKRAQETLKTSQKRLSQIINFLPDATMVIDLKGRVIAWNRAIENMTGVKAQEMLGKGDYEYGIPFYGERRPVLIDIVGQWNKEIGKKYQYVKKDGESLVSETYDPLVKPGGFLWNKASLLYDDNGEVIGAIESIRDITEKKVAGEALQESEEKYRTILESIEQGYYEIDIKGNFTFFNDSTCKILGYSKDELIGMNNRQYMDQENSKKIYQTFNRVYNTGKPAKGFACEVIIKNGIRHIETSVSLMKDSEGNPIGFRGIFWDVTEKKQMEAELIQTKDFLENIFNSSIDGITSTDLKGKIIYLSPKIKEMLGYDPKEAIGKKVSTFYGNGVEDAKKIMREFEEKRVLKNHDMQLIKKDGSLIDISLSASFLKDRKGEVNGILGVYKDITDTKKLEVQLQQARKMEAIATLAGGVAHEFNNALMGIMGNIELLKMDLPEDERRDRYFDTMKGSGHRMSRLTDQLLAYAEGGKYQPRDLKLDAFVIQTLPILRHDLSPSVRVETHFPKVSYIKADYAQMQMVLSAILANSNEAIKDEGLIRITAENKDVDEDFTKQHPGLKPGPYVCLTIEDDGKGMDKETRDGIFEPFFTTKFQGRGMGMAAVYGIVKNHDGWIYVDSALGKGTTVRIYLPAIEIEVEKPKKAEAEIATGSGTILMIEDEDVVIEVTQAMLERLGYRVMAAKTGEEATHITETFDGQIDLALLDIKLPDMEGGKVYPLIMKARPELKVIVFSGYAIDGPARKILDAGAEDFIQKPFSISTLAEKLKKVLGD